MNKIEYLVRTGRMQVTRGRIMQHAIGQIELGTIRPSFKSWLSLGFIVYISTLIGFGLWAHLLSKNIASKVVPFALLVPVFGMATSVLLIGEVVTWWKMLAMVLILSGLVLANIKIGLWRKAVRT